MHLNRRGYSVAGLPDRRQGFRNLDAKIARDSKPTQVQRLPPPSLRFDGRLKTGRGLLGGGPSDAPTFLKAPVKGEGSPLCGGFDLGSGRIRSRAGCRRGRRRRARRRGHRRHRLRGRVRRRRWRRNGRGEGGQGRPKRGCHGQVLGEGPGPGRVSSSEGKFGTAAPIGRARAGRREAPAGGCRAFSSPAPRAGQGPFPPARLFRTCLSGSS